GDAALIDYARQFDKADLKGKSLLASKGEIDAAFDKLDPELINALEYAADNIRRFHEKQKPPAEWRMEIRPGIEVGERAFPIDKVALYSPRGKVIFGAALQLGNLGRAIAGKFVKGDRFCHQITSFF
ncbi:MAG: hypothetical protein EBR12_02700, partial [Proteobacteria bacterium]|nr:hypothetical protein [Pseudomonadota bacterium]